MKKLTVVWVVAVMTAGLVIPTRASAAEAKTVAAAALIVTGGVMMVTAFDYDTSCPAGYTTHAFEGLPTQCVHVDRYGSDVINQPTTAEYARPTLFWSGVGAVGVGTLLALLPKGAQRATQNVNVSMAPGGWRASKTVRLGGK
jgi:hypothetical protein